MHDVRAFVMKTAAAFDEQGQEYARHGESVEWQALNRRSERALDELREALAGLPFTVIIDDLADEYPAGSNARMAIRLAVATMTAGA